MLKHRNYIFNLITLYNIIFIYIVLPSKLIVFFYSYFQIPIQRCKSRELRASELMTICDCTRRNGLQSSCPRKECQGRCECQTKCYPSCCPSKFRERYSRTTFGIKLAPVGPWRARDVQSVFPPNLPCCPPGLLCPPKSCGACNPCKPCPLPCLPSGLSKKHLEYYNLLFTKCRSLSRKSTLSCKITETSTKNV